MIATSKHDANLLETFNWTGATDITFKWVLAGYVKPETETSSNYVKLHLGFQTPNSHFTKLHISADKIYSISWVELYNFILISHTLTLLILRKVKWHKSTSQSHWFTHWLVAFASLIWTHLLYLAQFFTVLLSVSRLSEFLDTFCHGSLPWSLQVGFSFQQRTRWHTFQLFGISSGCCMLLCFHLSAFRIQILYSTLQYVNCYHSAC